MLDQYQRCRHAVRQRLRQAERGVLVEEMPVRKLGRAGDRTALDACRAGRAKPRERADVRPERGRLVPLEVGRRPGADPAVLVLANEQQVDDADDALVLQPVELGQDLALEVIAVEGNREHLDRAGLLHRVPGYTRSTTEAGRPCGTGLCRSSRAYFRRAA